MNAREGMNFSNAFCAKSVASGETGLALRERIAHELQQRREFMVAHELFSPHAQDLWKPSNGAMALTVFMEAVQLKVPELVAAVGKLASDAGYSPVNMKVQQEGTATTIHIANPNFDPARVWEVFSQNQQQHISQIKGAAR